MVEFNKKRVVEHGDHVVCLTHSAMIRLLAFCMVGAFILFLVGYFKGKQAATAAFNENPIRYAYALRLDHEHDAVRLTERLLQAGLDAQVQQQTSISPGGDQVLWYQIITKNFTNQEELVKLVERIRCQENFIGNVALSKC